MNLGSKLPGQRYIWGDRDPYIPARFADQFGAQTVKHFPDGGHWFMLEEPDTVVDQLSQFLRPPN